MSEFNHSRAKKKHYKEYSPDRVDNPIDHTEKPRNRIIERSKEKSVEQHLHEILGVNEKQPDHEKVLNKLIQGLVEQKLLKEKRVQENFVVEQRLHEILGVNEKQPDHEKVLNKLLHGLTEKKILKEKRIHEKSVEKNVHEVLGVNEKQPDHEKNLNSNQEEMKTIYLKTSKLPDNGKMSFALLNTNEIGLVEGKKEKISENKVNDPILTEHELINEGYDDLGEDVDIDEDYDDIIISKKIPQYLSIPDKIRRLISSNPEETKPFQDYLIYLYFVEKHPNIQKLLQEYKNSRKFHHFQDFRYSDKIIDFFDRKITQKDLNKWMGLPADSSKIEEMKKTVQLIKKFNSNSNVENTGTEPWKLIKWVVEHEPGKYSVSQISKIVPLQNIRPHLRLMFKEKYNNYILDRASEGQIRHRLIMNYMCKVVKSSPLYSEHYCEIILPFSDMKFRLDNFFKEKGREKYFLIDTTHDMRINSIVKKLIVYPPGDKAELLVVITNPDLTQDYKNNLYNQISHFNEKMKNKEGLKRDFIPKTTLNRIKLLNWKEFAHSIGIKENSDEWKELERICTTDREGLLEMEKNMVNQKVKGNKDFKEFLKSRKISDIFEKPDRFIHDNVSYLIGLKEHYPIVLNFIQFAQNLYLNDSDNSVNFGDIHSFLKANNEITDPLNPYWPNYHTTKIINGLSENKSISETGISKYKITGILLDVKNVNEILLDVKIKGIFKRKNPLTFKEIHEIIDSHVNQNYNFEKKWQPIDSYKILKYYERNLDGFTVKKKLDKERFVSVNKRHFYVGRHFPNEDENVLITVEKKCVMCYPSINSKEPPTIWDRLTGKRLQFYQNLHNGGKFKIDEIKFDVGEEHKNKLAVVQIDDEKDEISVFPDRNLNENPIVFNKITGRKIQFCQVLEEENGGFVYKNKIYSFPDYAGENVLIKFDEAENEILCFPEGNLENEPQVKPINEYEEIKFRNKTDTQNESKIVHFLIEIDDRNRPLFYYMSKGKRKCYHKAWRDIPSKKMTVTVNESENRIYIYPDQDLNKPPQILDLLTGDKIGMFYQVLEEENGGFVYKNKIYSFPEHSGENVYIKIDELENQILCFPNRNLEEESLRRPINESEEIQFLKKTDGRSLKYKTQDYTIWKDFPSKKISISVNESENRIYFYPDQDFNKPPQILDLLTGKRIQFYQKLYNTGGFTLEGVKFTPRKEHKNKLAVVRIDDERNEISVFPNRNLNETPIVFNKTTGDRIGMFLQTLEEENGGFVYKNKIYSFPEHAGENVLIKIDEMEKQILCFPNRNLDKEPLVIPINESDEIQFLKKIHRKNHTFTYKSKSYPVLKYFPSKNVAIRVNKSENRIYIHPDQDLSKPPQILELLTRKRIQFYQELHTMGEFQLNGIIFDAGEEHKNKLTIVRIDDEKNEISVFPNKNLNENPIVFNKITGRKIQFYQDLEEENGDFLYENKSKKRERERERGVEMSKCSFPELAGKKVLIKIDEMEKQILCFPNGNMEEEPLVKPINESEIIQFNKEVNSNQAITYMYKNYSVLKYFPSRNVGVRVNHSENRIYFYPDQDFNKPPQILNLLTGKRIQFYQKLYNDGEFKMNYVNFYLRREHKKKLAVVRINDEKNEVEVFPDGDLNKNPLVFNKTTGERIH